MTSNDMSFGRAIWRTKETEAQYQAVRSVKTWNNDCIMCGLAPQTKFKHWKIEPNKYPYDKVAGVHDLLYTIRHTTGHDLTTEERAELTELKTTYLNERYHFIIEPLPKYRSIPDHYHLHLIVAK